MHTFATRVAASLAAIFATVTLAQESDPVYPTAAVAADHPLASQAGAEILKAGGNAVDAAVAASFALSVVRPYSCGIGGGGFMVIRLPNDPKHGEVVTTVNYRETGIAAMRPEYFEKDPDPDAATHGGKAVCVPGTVAGLLYALEHYGTKPRAEVLAPAIRLAEEGFAADAHYEESAQNDAMVIPWLKKDEARQRRFAFLWERLLNKGEVRKGYHVALPEQADALRMIAEKGAAGFYQGPVAEAIVRAVRRDGGEMTLADLAAYKPEERAPLRAHFRGMEVLTMAPPSSGGIVLAQVLAMLEVRSEDLNRIINEEGHNSPAYIHLVTEAAKHAFADRARWMGDPNFVKVPTAAMLDPAYVRSRAQSIDLKGVLPHEAYGSAEPLPEDHGTSHLCAVDQWGGAVSCTETINLGFGSLLPVPEYGFILNDEVDDFVTREGVANAFGLSHAALNRPQPGKRPLSSMTPTIVVKDGKAVLLAGGSGGPRIISGTIQVTLNTLWLGMPPTEALSKPRFHHQWQPDQLQMEAALKTPENIAALDALGHKTGARSAVAAVQIIIAVPGGWQAGSDPRKGGVPAGY